MPVIMTFLFTVLAFSSLIHSQPLGSQDLEPGLVGRDDVIFFEDFESAAWYENWKRFSTPDNCALTSDPVFDGASALKVSVDSGQHYGVSMGFDFIDQGLEEPEEIFFRYYLYFPDSWRRNNSEVGKIPGISGTYNLGGWGGLPSNGQNGWSARMRNQDNGDQMIIGFYCYHADMTGRYGSNYPWEINSLGILERNQWYAIEAYARMNTITGSLGNNDGILRGWVNGEPAFEKTDLRFRDVDRLKIERIWFNIYVGGSWIAPQDMEVYFDNVVIARNYIGPRSSETSVAPGRKSLISSSVLEVQENSFAETVIFTFLNPDEKTCLSISDLRGKILWQAEKGKQNKIVWKAGALPEGLYFISVVSGNTRYSEKLMLIK